MNFGELFLISLSCATALAFILSSIFNKESHGQEHHEFAALCLYLAILFPIIYIGLKAYYGEFYSVFILGGYESPLGPLLIVEVGSLLLWGILNQIR
jgi:hypothetical protein